MKHYHSLLAASLIFAVGISSAAPPTPDANPKPADDADPFPITVRVLPGVVLAGSGSALTVSGSTMPAGERTLSISIKSEEGAALDTQQVKPDAKGNYSATRAAPAKGGTYRITVTAPDGRGTAQATFRAIEPVQIGPQADAAMAAAAGAAEDALSGLQAQIEAQVD